MQTYTLHVFYIDEYEYHDSIYITIFADTEKEAKKMAITYLKGFNYKDINILNVWNLNTRKNFLISNFAPRVFNDSFFEDLAKEMSEEDGIMG